VSFIPSAIEQYEKTLQLDSNFAAAHYNLAGVYDRKGMQKEAIAEWEKVMTASLLPRIGFTQ
jgi:tetratricopeptide (TPR) repeat protein